MDARNRVTLTSLLAGDEDISSFEAHREGERIILIPMTEIPASEAWLYKDKKALDSVKRGLRKGKTNERGSFAKYATDDV